MSTKRTPALFAIGFRPFFLCAGLCAVVVMLAWTVWMVIHAGGGALTGLAAPFPALLWHAHEMTFGFAAAVIAGFLLTAVRNWTGAETATGRSEEHTSELQSR